MQKEVETYEMNEELQKVFDALQGWGHKKVKETKKVAIFSSTKTQKNFCLILEIDGVRRDRLIGVERYAVVFDPRLPVEQLNDLPGVVTKSKEYNNSNMSCFPKHKNTGETEVRFGKKLLIEGLGNFGEILEKYDEL